MANNVKQLRGETAKQARAELMRYAPLLVRHKAACALGLETELDVALINENDFNDIWNAIVPILQQTGDLNKISAESTHDITAAISKGKITYAEGVQLMNLLRAESDITDIKDISAKLDSLSKQS